jgi:hypothetical protein
MFCSVLKRSSCSYICRPENQFARIIDNHGNGLINFNVAVEHSIGLYTHYVLHTHVWRLMEQPYRRTGVQDVKNVSKH